MNIPETFCVLPILTFYYFSHIPYFKHLNSTLYRLLEEMPYKQFDQCHCQLLVSPTEMFIYTFKNKFSYHISKENFSRPALE